MLWLEVSNNTHGRRKGPSKERKGERLANPVARDQEIAIEQVFGVSWLASSWSMMDGKCLAKQSLASWGGDWCLEVFRDLSDTEGLQFMWQPPPGSEERVAQKQLAAASEASATCLELAAAVNSMISMPSMLIMNDHDNHDHAVTMRSKFLLIVDIEMFPSGKFPSHI